MVDEYILLDVENFKKTRLLINEVTTFNRDVVLFGGSIKGGKTYAAVAAAILICNEYSNCRGVLVRKDMPVLERNTLPTIKKLMPLAYGGELKARKGYYTIEFSNGSELILLGENYSTDKELNRLRGFDINFAILEEVNELQEITFDKIAERVGTNKPSCNIPPFIIATCNPSFGWIKRRLYNVMTDPSRCPDRWLFIRASAFDNPAYTQEQFDMWKRTMTQHNYNVFVLGHWEQKVLGALLKEFDTNKHVKKLEIDFNKPLHLSFDNNVLPYISCSMYQIDTNKKEIYQVGEMTFSSPDNLAKRAGEILREYLKNVGFNELLFIYGDASGNNRSTADKLSFFGRIKKELSEFFKITDRINKKNPSVSMSAAFVNHLLSGNLKWQFFCNESNEYSIDDYIQTLEDENGGTQKIRTKMPDGNTYEINGHLTDTLRYFIVTLLNGDYKQFTKNIK